jgi:hypothetical protein
MLRVLAGLIAATMVAAPAFADETWKTGFGKIEWVDDFANSAIFELNSDKNDVTRYYVEGLTADGDRGHHEGYWIRKGGEDICSAEMVGPDGTRSKNWGRLSLTFVKGKFPSDWTALTGLCVGEPMDLLTGEAIVGQ